MTSKQYIKQPQRGKCTPEATETIPDYEYQPTLKATEEEHKLMQTMFERYELEDEWALEQLRSYVQKEVERAFLLRKKTSEKKTDTDLKEEIHDLAEDLAHQETDFAGNTIYWDDLDDETRSAYLQKAEIYAKRLTQQAVEQAMRELKEEYSKKWDYYHKEFEKDRDNGNEVWCGFGEAMSIIDVRYPNLKKKED